MPNDGEQDYEVGYGKPPQPTRFKKGQSGNPRGRPRGSKNLATLLNEEFEERVMVKENGQQKRITKRKASIKQFVNKLASGDHRYIPYLFRLMEKQESNGAAGGPIQFAQDDVLDVEDARKLQEAWKTIRAARRKGAG